MSKRREYSPAFKREAVELNRTPGVTVAQITREPGIRTNMQSRWRRKQGEWNMQEFSEYVIPATPVIPLSQVR